MKMLRVQTPYTHKLSSRMAYFSCRLLWSSACLAVRSCQALVFLALSLLSCLSERRSSLGLSSTRSPFARAKAAVHASCSSACRPCKCHNHGQQQVGACCAHAKKARRQEHDSDMRAMIIPAVQGTRGLLVRHVRQAHSAVPVCPSPILGAALPSVAHPPATAAL